MTTYRQTLRRRIDRLSIVLVLLMPTLLLLYGDKDRYVTIGTLAKSTAAASALDFFTGAVEGFSAGVFVLLSVGMVLYLVRCALALRSDLALLAQYAAPSEKVYHTLRAWVDADWFDVILCVLVILMVVTSRMNLTVATPLLGGVFLTLIVKAAARVKPGRMMRKKK